MPKCKGLEILLKVSIKIIMVTAYKTLLMSCQL